MASRPLLAAVAALSVFLLFCGPVADCCPLAVTVSAQTEHACCLDSEQTAATTATTATAGTIAHRAIVVRHTPALLVHEEAMTVLTLPPARAVLTVRLRI